MVDFIYFWKGPTWRPSDDQPMIVGCRKQDPDIVGYRSKSQIIDR